MDRQRGRTADSLLKACRGAPLLLVVRPSIGGWRKDLCRQLRIDPLPPRAPTSCSRRSSAPTRCWPLSGPVNGQGWRPLGECAGPGGDGDPVGERRLRLGAVQSLGSLAPFGSLTRAHRCLGPGASACSSGAVIGRTCPCRCSGHHRRTGRVAGELAYLQPRSFKGQARTSSTVSTLTQSPSLRERRQRFRTPDPARLEARRPGAKKIELLAGANELGTTVSPGSEKAYAQARCGAAPLQPRGGRGARPASAADLLGWSSSRGSARSIAGPYDGISQLLKASAGRLDDGPQLPWSAATSSRRRAQQHDPGRCISYQGGKPSARRPPHRGRGLPRFIVAGAAREPPSWRRYGSSVRVSRSSNRWIRTGRSLASCFRST